MMREGRGESNYLKLHHLRKEKRKKNALAFQRPKLSIYVMLMCGRNFMYSGRIPKSLLEIVLTFLS